MLWNEQEGLVCTIWRRHSSSYSLLFRSTILFSTYGRQRAGWVVDDCTESWLYFENKRRGRMWSSLPVLYTQQQRREDRGTSEAVEGETPTLGVPCKWTSLWSSIPISECIRFIRKRPIRKSKKKGSNFFSVYRTSFVINPRLSLPRVQYTVDF